MIIKLKGANFSTNNINALLNSYFVSIIGGSCVTAAKNISSVSKNSPTYSNTFTVNTDYSVSNVEVTMGGSLLSGVVTETTSEAGTVFTISNLTLTNNLSIKFTYTYNGVEEPDTTNYTFTINPTPSTATVTLTASGYTQSGNSITVPSGTSVTWSVSASGYTTQSGTQTVTSTSSKSVTLSATGGSDPDTSDYLFDTTGLTKLNISLSADAWEQGSVTATGPITSATSSTDTRYTKRVHTLEPIDITGLTSLYVKLNKTNPAWVVGFRIGTSQTSLPNNYYWYQYDEVTKPTNGTVNCGYLVDLPLNCTVAYPVLGKAAEGATDANTLDVAVSEVVNSGLEVWSCADITRNPYTLTITKSSAVKSVTVTKTSGYGTTGELTSNATIYKGDKLTVTAEPQSGFILEAFTENITVTGNVNINISAIASGSEDGYLFDKSDKTQLDLSSVNWVQGGWGATGPAGSSAATYNNRIMSESVINIPEGANKLYLKVNEPYEVGFRIGTSQTSLPKNLYWYNNNGSMNAAPHDNAGFIVDIPSNMTVFGITLSKDGEKAGDMSNSTHTIAPSDVSAAGLEIWY